MKKFGKGDKGRIESSKNTLQLCHHFARAGPEKSINTTCQGGSINMKQSGLTAFSLACASGFIDPVRHLVFFRMPKQVMTSVATTPILTLDTQTTGLTGKLGLMRWL